MAINIADVTIDKLKAISKGKKRNHLINEAMMMIGNAEMFVRSITNDQELRDKLGAKMAELRSIG